MKKTNLFIFDGKTEQLLTVLSNEDNNMSPFWEAPVEENLNGDFIFEFKAPINDSLVEGNLVAFKDSDSEFQLFQIYKANKYHIDGQINVHVWCEHSFYELSDDIVEDLRVTDGTASEAMTKALSSSRWQVGTVADLGTGTVNFYYQNATKNLQDVVATFGGELKYRVTISGNQISGRFVDLLTRRGSDTGKRFEYNKDLVEVNRTVQVDGLKTALYGRGTGEQLDTGGYSRKVTFADVVWVQANGNPVDKPAGQEWVGDPDALAQWGRSGGTRHRFGAFDVDSTDPTEILNKTWQELQRVSIPLVTYELKVIDLERIAGLEHEKVRIGDTVFVIDRDLNVRIEARVVKITYNLEAPENSEVILGNFIDDITNYNSKLEQVQATLTDRKGVWDKANDAITEVDDSNIVVQAPSVPANVSAQGLFKSIILSWTFDPSIKTSAYEVYASKVQGFTVDSTNLVYRGKSGGFILDANTNETWYFRLRSLNPAGTASAFTQEFSASTIQIATPDFEDLSVTNEKVSNLSADKITFGTLDGNLATITNIDADNINAGMLKAQYVQIGSTTHFDVGYNPAPAIKAFYDTDFVNDKAFWSESYNGQTVTPTTAGTINLTTEASRGGKTWLFTGESTIYSLNALPVNTSRVYKTSFRVRQTADPTTSLSGVDLGSTAGISYIYMGIACLDSNYSRIGSNVYQVNAVAISVADGWQYFEGTVTGIGTDGVSTFPAGTVFVRPVFVVNYQNADGIAEVDYLDFQDVTEIQNLQESVSTISIRTTDDSIISTVRNSQSYQNDLQTKADTSDLENYASTDDLNQAKTDLQGYTNQQIENIDFTPYATTTYVDQKADALDFKIESSGGVNLLKNSVGYAGTDFWTVTLDKDVNNIVIGSVSTLQNAELDEKGVGSGLQLLGANLKQVIVNSPQYHTISTLVKKGTTGSGYLKVTYTDSHGVQQVNTTNFVSGTAYDYELVSVIIETGGNTITVELYGTTNSGIIFTGTMVNIGNVALTWQHSAGEIYNTNVLMDLNGIRVNSSAYNGYTAITPQEFSGYAEVPDANNNLVMAKVFTLNKDVTEVSKIQVDQQIDMAPIKIVSVTGTYNGWAFIAD